MSSGFRIRAYRPGPDDAALVALWADALGATWPATPAAIVQRLKAGQHLIAEDAHGCAAFAGIHARGNDGHVAVLMVRGDLQRQGVGTRMLATALAELKERGVRTVRPGAGFGPYFWSGVPENLPGAIAFFRKHGWALEERTADMEADLAGYRTPEWIAEREAAAGMTISAAQRSDAEAILEFERKHFPDWHAYFVPCFDREQTGILVARSADGTIAGTVLVDLPNPSFIWEPLLPQAGAFGCIGVAEAFRERGIGMALCARAHERLHAHGVRRAFLGWVVLFDWYAKLGYRMWRTYRGGARSLG